MKPNELVEVCFDQALSKNDNLIKELNFELIRQVPRTLSDREEKYIVSCIQVDLEVLKVFQKYS